MKEYVQSSRLDQCSLRATNQEKYVALEIPQYLINHWKTEGYTALHFGAVRLILSLHGRKNQPVYCKIALLDLSYLHYENVVIGTVLTIFPNYNVSLSDNTLSTRLKVQVQITGTDQVPEAMPVTLHHQIIYRLQNHSIDLPLSGIHGKKKPLSIYEEGLKILRKEGLLPPDDPTLVTWSPTDHCKSPHPPTVVQPIPCFMYSTATPEHERQFPSPERKMDPITGRTSKPFIHPSEVQPDGKLKPLTQAEEVLNWQSENMVSQNEILQSLDKRVDKIAEKIDETDDNLKVLSQKMQKHYRSLM
ncbi:hypothetical protein KIW84_030029 [Lathyrus oleraceus]|uniref:Uncharacterized protein n=1 Tax=Pisum sativum TaxID=3888 RepID=A0A9D4XPA9_PEA|nr:hypothetical protein KIW84_030029 [Pisum sativum]